MKNRISYLLTLFLLPAITFAQGFVIKGKISGIANGYASLKMIPYTDSSVHINDIPGKVKIVNGEFELKGKVDLPQDAFLQISTKKVEILLENMVYTVETPFSELSNSSVKGGVLNLYSLKYDSIRIEADDYAKRFPDEEFSAWLLYKFFYNKPGRLKPAFANLSPAVQNSYYGRILKPLVESGEQTSPLGRMAPVSVLTSPEGKEFSWDRFKGSLLVVDFWASWCSPCRKFIPTLNEIYKEYSPKGVEFMSVSVDDHTGPWKKALEQEKMPWHQAIGQHGFTRHGLSNQFFFYTVPYLIIIGKDGKVVSMLDFYNKEKLTNELDRLMAESR